MSTAARAIRRQRHDAGERPFIVNWEFTRACPLACLHCRAEAVPDRNPRELDTAAAQDLLHQVAAFGQPAVAAHVVVLVRMGRKTVDHEYVLVSSELYLGTPGSAAQVAKMSQETPDAWVFNGAAAQCAKAPLTLKAGERARFWVVAAGPRDGTAFHVVSTVFDAVYKEGTYSPKPGDSRGSQVLDLAPAQGWFVQTTFPEAVPYSFIDHDSRHAEAGAMGMVEVSD
ncbi:hypothetical protein [Streptomyces sp. NPDC051286]|uniref:hypothetical protein n=1 Tax=Streptomyces sp. NPDC051286 TaxID=3365647 RepID=UPI00379E20FC